MRAKDAVGRYGEDVAVRHLRDDGWQIVERNWRCRYGELDVVALDTDGTLVFVEVKTRSSVAYGVPAEAVSRRKMAQLRRLAGIWLSRSEPLHNGLRFDVVSVLRRPRGAALVEHLHGVF